AAQTPAAADPAALAQPEAADRLLRPGDLRPLTGDLGQLLRRLLQAILVLQRLADAHVDDDLLQLRQAVLVRPVELLRQARRDLLGVPLEQPGRVRHRPPLPQWPPSGRPLASNHFRRQIDDADELLVAQLPADRAEDARAARVVLGVDQHHGVAVETDVTAVVAPRRLLRPHDHAAHHVARLDFAAGDRLLHRGDDDVTQKGVP